MIIKCMTNFEDKEAEILTPNQTNNQNLKLPIIQSSVMTSSRSANKTKVLSVFDSLKYLASDHKEKQYTNVLLKSPKRSQGIQIILQPKTSFQVKKNRSKRIKTDSSQVVSQSCDNKNSFRYKKNIAQKILKITQELGMGGADYKNYMKTERKTKTHCNIEVENQNKVIHRIKDDLISQSLPIDKPNTANQQELNEQNQQVDKNENRESHVLNVLRYNLKKKPTVKSQAKQQAYSKEGKKLLKLDKDLRYTNKSIRGWTKYGKIQQEIQNV